MDRNVDRLEDVTDSAMKICTTFMVVLITVIVFTTEPRESYSNEELVRSVQMLYAKFSAVVEYKERVEELLLESYWYHTVNERRLKYIAGSRLVTRQRFLYCQNQLHSLQLKYDKVRDDYRKLSQEMNTIKNITRLR